MRINLEEQDNLEPNMAPLLDCIFLLLIFFLVATTFEKQKQEDKPVEELFVQLPDSAVAIEAKGKPDAVTVITIDSRGKLYFNGQRVDTNTLHAKIRLLAASQAEQTIRIDGDRNTPLQHVVHVLDLCEFEGLHNISIRAASDVPY